MNAALVGQAGSSVEEDRKDDKPQVPRLGFPPSSAPRRGAGFRPGVHAVLSPPLGDTQALVAPSLAALTDSLSVTQTVDLMALQKEIQLAH